MEDISNKYDIHIQNVEKAYKIRKKNETTQQKDVQEILVGTSQDIQMANKHIKMLDLRVNKIQIKTTIR